MWCHKAYTDKNEKQVRSLALDGVETFSDTQDHLYFVRPFRTTKNVSCFLNFELQMRF